MVADGAADRAGLEDDDVVVEVNGVNVESSTHEEVVALIRDSSSSLELLVATKSVYDQLKCKGVAITRLLLGSTSFAMVHTPATTLEEVKEEERRKEEEEDEDKKEEEGRKEEDEVKKARPETPPAPARERVSGAL